VIAGWVTDFNTARPHSAIGCMTPAAYAATLKSQRAPAPSDLEALRRCPHTRSSQPMIPVADG
jgi:putative transposase